MLKQKIQQDFKEALKNKDTNKMSVLRMINAAIRNEEIAQKKKEKGLGDDKIIEVVSRLVKQHKDSIEQFRKAGRDELVQKEQAELQILQDYLPEQLSEEEIHQEVKKAVEQVGSNFGAVMGKIMSQFKGQVEGAQVKNIVEEELS